MLKIRKGVSKAKEVISKIRMQLAIRTILVIRCFQLAMKKEIAERPADPKQVEISIAISFLHSSMVPLVIGLS